MGDKLWGGIAEARASMLIMPHGLSYKVRLTGVTVRRHRPTHSLSPMNRLIVFRDSVTNCLNICDGLRLGSVGAYTYFPSF